MKTIIKSIKSYWLSNHYNSENLAIVGICGLVVVIIIIAITIIPSAW